VHALITAEAMRTMFLLMSELHTASYCEETYSSADLSSIARASFGVRLWLRRINLGLEGTFTSTMTKQRGRYVTGAAMGIG
jgi:hypothetical protein